MTYIKKKILLNAILILAILILFATGFIAWQRNRTQNAYEALATLRAEQKNALKSTSESESYSKSESNSDTDLQNIEPTLEASKIETIQYTYKPNENSKWLAINKDYFGWIRIEGTNIDYPFVRSHDNKDYLNLDFNGNVSDAGTLFMDYRNLGNFNDQHTIIYGHYMKNKTLFHNLTNYHEKEYYEENQIIEIDSLYETKTYKIFSVYEISADEYAFTLNFENDSDNDNGITYQSYLDQIVRQSMHTPDFEIDSNQRLLTLVTCSYGVGNGRTIVHAIEI